MNSKPELSQLLNKYTAFYRSMTILIDFFPYILLIFDVRRDRADYAQAAQMKKFLSALIYLRT
jgi:hypothetical protein